MWTRKVEIEGPWVWTKAKMKSDMEDYFIVEGVLLILTFFVLVMTIGGPYMITEVSHYENSLDISEVPIWVVFLHSGSIAILIGMSLKAPRLLMKPGKLVGVTLLAAWILAWVNVFGMAAYFLYWFMIIHIGPFSLLQPAMLFITCYMSTIYLYVQGSFMPRLEILAPPSPIPEPKRHILF